MIGYKAFNKDLTCRGFQYEIGQIYETNEEPKICKSGFHFCKAIVDCYNYYNRTSGTRICKVEALGKIDSDENGDKLCTNKIKIINEVTTYCNTGDRNTGNYNAGDRNTGHCNTGDYNTGNYNAGDYNAGTHNTGYCNAGDRNAGDRNTGNYNTGDRNTGHRNTGHCNAGYYNTGNYNTGHHNTGYCNAGTRNTGYCNAGDRNTGHCNAGYYNTGDYNTGNYNTGDYNIGDCNTGVFCTKKEPKIRIFDNVSNWTLQEWLCSRAKDILSRCPMTKTTFVRKENMSKEERIKHPEYNTLGGYLKVNNVENSKKKAWWNNLEEEERQEILNLPNFDKNIFFECTGIEID